MEKEMIDKNIILLYQEEKPLKYIREMYNISDMEIYRILEKNNIPLKTRRRLTKVKEQEIIDLYKEGISIKDIVKSASTTPKTIYRVLDRNNIEYRNNI